MHRFLGFGLILISIAAVVAIRIAALPAVLELLDVDVVAELATVFEWSVDDLDTDVVRRQPAEGDRHRHGPRRPGRRLAVVDVHRRHGDRVPRGLDL